MAKEDSVTVVGYIKEEPRSIGGHEISVIELKIINSVRVKKEI